MSIQVKQRDTPLPEKYVEPASRMQSKPEGS